MKTILTLTALLVATAAVFLAIRERTRRRRTSRVLEETIAELSGAYAPDGNRKNQP